MKIKSKNVFNVPLGHNFNDTLYPDGSKTYETFNYGYIHVKNPTLVKLIDKVISMSMYGFSYVPLLIEYEKRGLDKYNEIEKAYKILD